MNYIQYLRKKFQDYSAQELAILYFKAYSLKKSKNKGENSIGESIDLAIEYILKEKSLEYYRKFIEIKRRIYEQKRIY